MKVDFVRFKTPDEVGLTGLLSVENSETAVVHIHGMSGNGYENYFLDSLREVYSALGISFLAFDNRGSGIINHFRQGSGTKLGGSCFELFEECSLDIKGALTFLKDNGKKKFILQGHSLGCSKAVHYLTTESDSDVIGVILLAPTDMVRWADIDPRNSEYLKKSEELLTAGKGEELVGAQCWEDKTPLSAQTYPSICKPGTAVDIFSEQPDGTSLSRLKAPTLIAYGDQDIGITLLDSDFETWQQKVKKAISSNTDIKKLAGAEHSFRNFEESLANYCGNFVKGLL